MIYTTTIYDITTAAGQVTSAFDVEVVKQAIDRLLIGGIDFSLAQRCATHEEMVAHYGPEYATFMTPDELSGIQPPHPSADWNRALTGGPV